MQMIAAIYARVSTEDQHCELQLAELGGFAARSGWDTAQYIDKLSGKAGVRRPQLEKLLADARLRKFDIVLVWKLDRFSRSLQDLMSQVETLDRAGVRFIVPSMNIDTDQKSPMGRFIIHMFGAFAEFERALIVERVNAGVAEYMRAFAAGKIGKDRHSRSGKDLPAGRPRHVFRRDRAVALRAAGKSWRYIEAELGVPQSTIRLALKTASPGVQ
jgi:putative DNA-invertase from lambdoid prophage Rac